MTCLRGLFSACLLALFAAGGGCGVRAEPAPVADVLSVGPDDHVFGSSDAPVTVIQYASLTCPQCRKFHEAVWPRVKSGYVDTGKVRFVIREFPLDALSLGGFMLSDCMGAARWPQAVDQLYRSEARWIGSEDPVGGLHEIMQGLGMDSRRFEDCLTDQAAIDRINAVKEQGERAGVRATPTFFVGAAAYEGFVDADGFTKVLDEALSR